MAMPAVIDPPGLLMYSWMSLSGSSASRNSICAMARFATVVVDRRADEDDAVLEQPREDVVRALAPVGLLDHHRVRVACESLETDHPYQ